MSADISHVANRCIHLFYHIYLSKLKFFQVAPNRTSNQPLDGLSLQPEHDEMFEAANPNLNSDDDMNNAMDDGLALNLMKKTYRELEASILCNFKASGIKTGMGMSTRILMMTCLMRKMCLIQAVALLVHKNLCPACIFQSSRLHRI